MKLSDTNQRQRLFDSVEWNYKQLEYVRERRKLMVEQCAGDLYQKDRSKKLIAGLMRQAAQVHTMSLAPRMPKVLISCHDRQKAAFASLYGRAFNRHLKEIRVDQTLQSIALDSFFGSAFAKVYLAESLTEIEEDLDVWVDPGRGFVERKSIDDMCFDTTAKDFRKCSFIADRFQVPLEALLENKQRFKRNVVEAFTATRVDAHNETRDITGSDRTSHKGRFLDMVDLVDVYIPRERVTYTFVADDRMRIRDFPPIQEVPWDGDDVGPYKHLNLGPVPDNILSASPAHYLYHLDVAYNQNWRKLVNQMQRQKVNLLSQTEDDVKKLQDASDGEIVYVNDPESFEEKRLGGPDNQQIGATAVIGQLFDRGAGNLQQRAGLGASTGTVGQDQILQQQLSAIDANMQVAFKDFAVSIFNELGRMLWDDPVTQYDMEAPIPGASITAPESWLPAGTDGARLGEWNDYDFNVEPFPTRYRTPEGRAQELRQMTAELVQQIPYLMQVGADVPAYIEELAELSDLPRLREVFAQLLEPQVEQGSQQQQALPNQNKPNGEYTRTNVSGGGDMNGDIIQQMMAGGGDA